MFKMCFHIVFIIFNDLDQNWLGNLRRRPAQKRLKKFKKMHSGVGVQVKNARPILRAFPKVPPLSAF